MNTGREIRAVGGRENGASTAHAVFSGVTVPVTDETLTMHLALKSSTK